MWRHALTRKKKKNPEPAAALFGLGDSERLELLDLATDQISDPIFTIDRSFRLTWANGAVLRLLGKSHKELVGEAPAYLLSESNPEGIRDDVIHSLTSGKEWKGEVRLSGENGGFSFHEVVIRPLLEESGSIRGYVGTMHDITERKKVKADLQQSEEKSRTIVDSAPGMLAITDSEGKNWYVSPSCKQLTGYSQSELQDNFIWWVHEDDTAKARAVFARAVQEGTEESGFLYRAVRKDAEVRWFSSSWKPIQRKDGMSSGIVVHTTDVTERINTEAALRESKERYRSLFNNMQNGFALYEIVTDEEGNPVDYVFLDVNPTFVAQTGLREEDIIGRKATVVLPGIDKELDEWATWIARYGDVAIAGRPVSFELFQAIQQRWYSMVSYQPHEGQFAVISTDITEKKRSEEALQQSEKLLRRAERIGRMGYWTLDPLTLAVTGSDELFDIFGLDQGQVTLDAFAEAVHPEDREYDLDTIRRGIEFGENWDIEHRLLTKDGIEKIVHAVGEVVTDETGKAVLLVGTVRDITKERRAENALRESEEKLRQSQKLESLGRLAGGIAHDFNNLLTTILGYSDLITIEEGLSDTALEGIQEIGKSASRAATLTRQLLAFSRKQILRMQPTNLNELIMNARNMLVRLIPEDVTIDTILSPETRTINADPGQIDQILMNLIVNAGDAMSGGGTVTIRTRNVHSGKKDSEHTQTIPGDYVEMTVSDTGHGMDEETIAHIFDPFYTTKDAGTGLGLATVYGIVKQSGGLIHAGSEPNRGTRFTIHFPVVVEAEGHPARSLRRKGFVGGDETILLVEDEKALRKMVERTLEGFGYSLIVATNGKDALAEVARADCPDIDCVVTDVVMPEMGGKELLDKLQSKWPSLKALFISGYTDKTISHHGVLDEGVNFLQKPFSPQILAERVRDILDSD
jgi:two-component system, cell cycle sensor histidine kinase and response regulator CckA